MVFRSQTGNDHRALRLSVGLRKYAPEAILSAPQHVWRDRRGAVRDAAEAELGGNQRRLFQDHGEHRRNEERQRGTLALRQFHESRRVELFHYNGARTPDQSRQEESSRGVRNWRGVQERVGRTDVRYQIRKECRQLCKLAACRQGHRLRPSSGAAGIAEPQRRIQRSINTAGPGIGVTDQRPHPITIDCQLNAERAPTAPVDHGAAAAVLELEPVVILCLADVERDPHQAGLRERVVGDQTIDAVREQHPDAIADRETARQECIAEPIRQYIEVSVADRPITFGQTGRVLVLKGTAPYERSNLHDYAILLG